MLMYPVSKIDNIKNKEFRNICTNNNENIDISDDYL